jgi:hypothetical protein
MREALKTPPSTVCDAQAWQNWCRAVKKTTD